LDIEGWGSMSGRTRQIPDVLAWFASMGIEEAILRAEERL